jgi:excisionase family DNA binding protein
MSLRKATGLMRGNSGRDANATRRDKATDSERRQDDDPVATLSSDSGPLLTMAEAAELLHVHPRTVQRLVRSGTLPAVRLGRAIRFDSRDVRELTNRLKGCAPRSEGRP